MSKSGITRRIDELGRIVVPKEIRYNLGIRDGEPLEIYTSDNSIIIKKYSQVENIKDLGQNICDIIFDVCNVGILVSDREKVVSASNNLKDLLNFKLNEKYKSLIDNRESYYGERIETDFNNNCYFIALPIITQSDCSGLVIILSKDKKDEYLKYARIAQRLIIQKLDVA